MFVADDPGPGRWPKELLGTGTLQVFSTTEVYGEDLVVDASWQRAAFADALALALAEGYAGLRVAADNTSLVSTPEGLEAWAEWEDAADRFMTDNPVTGLCAFDRQKLQPDILRFLMRLHRVRVER